MSFMSGETGQAIKPSIALRKQRDQSVFGEEREQLVRSQRDRDSSSPLYRFLRLHRVHRLHPLDPEEHTQASQADSSQTYCKRGFMVNQWNDDIIIEAFLLRRDGGEKPHPFSGSSTLT